MSDIQPSDAASDPLWTLAYLYMDDMLDKNMDLIEDVPRVNHQASVTS
jgi:hypothetical protein